MAQQDRRPAARRPRRGYTRGPHLFARKGWYYVRDPGHAPPEFAAHTRDPAAADRFLREYLEGRRGAAGGVASPAAESALAVIAARYTGAAHGWTRRTLSSCEARASTFVAAMRALGAEYPSQVTNDRLDAWITARGAEVGRATINRDLNVARKMLRWASHPDQGLCAEGALLRRRNLREPRRTQRRTLPSPGEIAATVKRLEKAGERGAALTVAAGSVSGMRLDQLRHLRAEDVTSRGVHVMPEAGAANVAWTDKGYDARLIPLAPEAVAVMRAFVRWRDTGTGGKGKRPGVSDGWIADKIDAAIDGTKLPRFRMHDLRRTFATEAVRAGVPITVVSRWLGHKDIATTERYVGVYRGDAEVTAPVTPVARALPASAVPRALAAPRKAPAKRRVAR